jgi:DNA-binding CsgD family transcriptional regulator
MTQHQSLGSALNAQSVLMGFPALIDSIGMPSFDGQLLQFLVESCGADHCAAYQLAGNSLHQIAAVSRDGSNTARKQVYLYVSGQYWRRDPTLSEARRRSAADEGAVIRVDPQSLADSDLRNRIYPQIRERLMVCGGFPSCTYVLSILRSDPHKIFSDQEVDKVAVAARALLSTIAKHQRLVDWSRSLGFALSSVDAIGHRMRGGRHSLSGREVDVCARILYGSSAAEIADVLRIGQESVTTYRKRAYGKLGIATRHELLLWYLALPQLMN